MHNQILSLDGEWRLFHFAEGDEPVRQPADLLRPGLISIPAQVPGNVELDLQQAGQLPDPYYAANIQQLRPLETHAWWYQRSFMLPETWSGEGCQLVFGGLDTLATVWVNDTCVGRSENMLSEQRFDVSAAIQAGQQNTITVRLASAVNAARQFRYEAGEMSWEHRAEGLYIRKAPHVWGWDILPRAVSAGLWRPVWLESLPATAIEQLYYWTAQINPGGAILGVWFQFRTSSPSLDGFSMRFSGHCQPAQSAEQHFEYEWPVEFLVDHCTIPIPGAQLWWPAGYGEACLYTVTAQLCYQGQVLAQRSDRVGLRQVILDRTEVSGLPWSPEPPAQPVARIDQPADPGSHFVISVNGEPIMIKGTNWVPLDAFHSRDAQRLEQALQLAKDLNCNMIRCWGGNVYPEDAFYEACDAAGILVWQDFAFACNRYPQSAEFLEVVRREVECVARRLRNHPSLAVWCGDNEIDMAYLADGLNPEHNRLTREVIPQALQRCDPQRAYIPSSPYVPPAVRQAPDPWRATPEQHLWGPRGYFKSPFYTGHSAHFIGEIGYHGCPNVSSIRKFISPAALWPWQDNPEWQIHAVYHWLHQAIDRDRIRLMANQIRELFGFIPGDLETFALASQITQAEAKKFFVESTRMRKWQTSGILWWNLLDGWPQFSDAVVDYFFGVKLAYHYLWRVQRPVCVMLGEAGSGKYLPVVIGNDSCQPAEVRYRVWQADSNETVAEGTFYIPANQNWQVDRIRIFAGDQHLYLIEWQVGDTRAGNHYLAGSPPFDVQRYQVWLPQIAALPRAFNADRVAR
jgi:beta-mannosidase